MNNLKQVLGATVVAASFVMVPGASAAPTPIAPSGSIFNGAGLSEQVGFFGGAIIATSTDSYVAPTFTGDLVSWVIAGDANNPYGGLDFVYQFSNNIGGAPSGIHRLTVSGFETFATSVGFNNLFPGGGFARGRAGCRESCAHVS